MITTYGDDGERKLVLKQGGWMDEGIQEWDGMKEKGVKVRAEERERGIDLPPEKKGKKERNDTIHDQNHQVLHFFTPLPTFFLNFLSSAINSNLQLSSSKTYSFFLFSPLSFSLTQYPVITTCSFSF